MCSSDLLVGTLFVLHAVVACSTGNTYVTYTVPEGESVINLTVDSQVNPSSFLEQESDGVFDFLLKTVNALNSTTFLGAKNGGITSIDGAYLSSPGHAYFRAKITPGKHKIGTAAFISNNINFYDQLEYDFKNNVNYVVRIEAHGPEAIKTSLVDADTNRVLVSSK